MPPTSPPHPLGSAAARGGVRALRIRIRARWRPWPSSSPVVWARVAACVPACRSRRRTQGLGAASASAAGILDQERDRCFSCFPRSRRRGWPGLARFAPGMLLHTSPGPHLHCRRPSGSKSHGKGSFFLRPAHTLSNHREECWLLLAQLLCLDASPSTGGAPDRRPCVRAPPGKRRHELDI